MTGIVSTRAGGHLFAGTLLTVAVRLGGLALAFVASVVMARWLGPEQRGLFAAVAGVAGLAVQFANLGIHSALTYFAARQPLWARGLAALAWKYALGMGVAASLIVLTLYALSPRLFGHIPPLALFLALATVPLSLAMLFAQSLLLGWSAVGKYNAVEAANKVFAAILITGWVLVMPSALGAVSATLLVQALTVGVAGYLVWTILRTRTIGDLPRWRLLVEYGLRNYLNAGLVYLLIRSDILLLNYFAIDRAEMGHYSIAVQMADFLLILPASVGTLVFPLVAAESTESGEWTARVTRTLLPVHAVACVLTALAARLLVPLVFGQLYAPAVPLLWQLLPGVLALGLVNPLSQHLAGRGMPWPAVVAWVPPLAVNALVNVAMIPRFGASAAAVSSSVAYLLAAVLLVRVFLRHTRLTGRDLAPKTEDLSMLLARFRRRR